MTEKSTQTWYRLSTYKSDLDPVEVTRVTEKSVWYMRAYFGGEKKEERAARCSSYYRFFPTFAEAKAYKVELARQKLKRAQSALDTARNSLRDAEALKEPPHE